ncbi:MAG: permease prefix domain 1-containing protein [Candidatus Sulfopaludibacter sp.]|nr:permease prefix domain 1-containing protein [Candidatus Sulfopaludibacter sp.]
MSWIKRFASSLRGGRLEEELDKELEFHLAMRAREKTAGGTTPEEARVRRHAPAHHQAGFAGDAVSAWAGGRFADLAGEWSDSWSDDDLREATLASVERFEQQEREGR